MEAESARCRNSCPGHGRQLTKPLIPTAYKIWENPPLLDFVYLLVEAGYTLETSPVLTTQVIDRIKAQRAHGMSTGVVTVSRDPEAFASTVGSMLADTQSPYVCVGPSRLCVRLFDAAFSVRRFIRRYGAKYVYVRDPWSALAHQMAFPIGGPDLIYDMRGDVAAEARFNGTSRAKRWVIDRLMSRAVRHANLHYAVSTHAARLMADQYGARDVHVIPSCVDIASFEQASSERDAVRQSLGVAESDVLVVYAGGDQRYQMLPHMFRIWHSMASDDSVRFLALTNDTTRVEGGIELDIPRGRGTRISVDRDRIPAYLNAADIGFLLRSPDPLNTVASPVKFGEYLAAGLSVISSPGIGDVSNLIEQQNLGVLVDPNSPELAAKTSLKLVSRVRENRAMLSGRSRETARNKYSWGAYLADWNGILEDT